MPDQIVLRADSITIDGNLSDFSTSDKITFSDASERSWKQNNNAVAKVMWDESNLYFGVEITDTDLTSRISQNDDPDIYEDDNLEIFIDPQSNGGSAAENNDYRFTINLTGKVLDGRGWSDWNWDSNISTKVIPRGSLNNNGDIDEGYTVEASIPWSDLGITPEIGKDLGFQLGVTDIEAAGDYEFFWMAVKRGEF